MSNLTSPQESGLNGSGSEESQRKIETREDLVNEQFVQDILSEITEENGVPRALNEKYIREFLEKIEAFKGTNFYYLRMKACVIGGFSTVDKSYNNELRIMNLKFQNVTPEKIDQEKFFGMIKSIIKLRVLNRIHSTDILKDVTIQNIVDSVLKSFRAFPYISDYIQGLQCGLASSLSHDLKSLKIYWSEYNCLTNGSINTRLEDQACLPHTNGTRIQAFYNAFNEIKRDYLEALAQKDPENLDIKEEIKHLDRLANLSNHEEKDRRISALESEQLSILAEKQEALAEAKDLEARNQELLKEIQTLRAEIAQAVLKMEEQQRHLESLQAKSAENQSTIDTTIETLQAGNTFFRRAGAVKKAIQGLENPRKQIGAE